MMLSAFSHTCFRKLSDYKQKSHKELHTEDKTKPDQRSTLNQDFTPVQEPKSERYETTSLMPKPNLKPETELTEEKGQH